MSYQFDRNSIIPRYKLVAFIIMGIGLLILGKARHEIQDALMHYDLQPEYKALNERAGKGYE